MTHGREVRRRERGEARRALLAALVGLGLAACGSQTLLQTTSSTHAGGGGHGGADTPDAAAPDATADAPPPDAAPPDAGPPTTCDCPMDAAVYQFGECTPPLEIGCPAETCTPGVTDCGPGKTCEPCGAAACCWCEACVPACVFTSSPPAPLPEYLKIMPVTGPAGQAIDIRIEGFPFYVGALFYTARVGDSEGLMQTGGSTCSFTVHAPGQPPGMVPVWASQYGGGGPWVLAGFFTWSAGDYPSCAQPGFPCDTTQPCCETADVPMACVAGRCRTAS